MITPGGFQPIEHRQAISDVKSRIPSRVWTRKRTERLLLLVEDIENALM